MIDYAVLRVIWWVLMGVILCGFAIMDGFDLGVAALLPMVARGDMERRVAINTVGPVWEGNQVWIILGGGVFFAAWPYLYAVSFSGFYFAILLVLATFIMRPVGFKYRSKLTSARWRSIWDWILALSGLIAALTFGVAVGNVLQGVPFHFNEMLRPFYTGSFFALFNPFALLCGLVSVAMLLMQGGHYLIVKTEGVLQARAAKAARIAAIFLIVLFAAAGVWVAKGINGYVVMQIASHHAPSNPLQKDVARQVGAWISNYYVHPSFTIAPLLGFLGALGALVWARRGQGKWAFICSSLSVFGVVATVGVSMFPFILPSSSALGSSLLVWDASASQLSLTIMLVCTIIFLPIILLYTAWVYRVLRGKVTAAFFDDNKNAY